MRRLAAENSNWLFRFVFRAEWKFRKSGVTLYRDIRQQAIAPEWLFSGISRREQSVERFLKLAVRGSNRTRRLVVYGTMMAGKCRSNQRTKAIEIALVGGIRIFSSRKRVSEIRNLEMIKTRKVGIHVRRRVVGEALNFRGEFSGLSAALCRYACRASRLSAPLTKHCFEQRLSVNELLFGAKALTPYGLSSV